MGDSTPHPAPELSVQIPSWGRDAALDRLLTALLADPAGVPIEVLVGLDGGSPEAAASLTTAHASAAHSAGVSLSIEALPSIGSSAVRVHLLNRAAAPITVTLNDDVVTHPGFLRAHLDAHRTAARGSATPTIVTGPAPFASIDRPTVFDALVQRTGLVFFDAHAAAQNGTLNYRHCYMLNLSFPTDLARESGALTATKAPYGYEDICLAHRLISEANARVIWRDDATVVHHHRYQPADIVRREYLLGLSAAEFAILRPAFAWDLFRREIRAPESLANARGFLRTARRDAVRVHNHFLSLGQIPAPNPDAIEPLLPALAESWGLLKRWLWWRGVTDAVSNRAPRDLNTLLDGD